jgi:alkylated DNA repair dioxygenase AlkB
VGTQKISQTIEGGNKNLLSRDGTLNLFTDAVPNADSLFVALRDSSAWKQEIATLFGRRIPVPRLVAWHGDAAYKYSGILHRPREWTQPLLLLKRIAEKCARANFNSVLLNLYRDGQDSMGWHSDDEKELGDNPVIASLSLGAERVFHLRHKTDPALKLKLPLPHGSCLVMGGAMQHHWQHALPKTARPLIEFGGARINLTFRLIAP